MVHTADLLSLLIAVCAFGFVVYWSRTRPERASIASRLFGWTVVVIGLIVGAGGVVSFVLGVVVNAYQVTDGPPWPIDPAFSAQSPSEASPFDDPFDVTNKSSLVDITGLSIYCEIVVIKAKRLTVTKDFRGKLLFASRGPNPLLAAGSLPATFTCPFREYLYGMGLGGDALDDPKEARIALVGEYKTPWWWHGFWFEPHRETRVIFTLDVKTKPPRWVPGVPLQ
jgi:hypothetical protein